MNGRHVHRVAEGDAGQRLDRYLRKLLASVPLSALHRMLRKREITVDGARAAPGLRLEAGASIELRGAARAIAGELAPVVAHEAVAWRGTDVAILYRDNDVLAVDKPAGVAVQPGAAPCLVDWLASRPELASSQPSRTFRPGPAHRIDRATSGVVLVGLSAEGLRGLVAAFREGAVEKTYLALVCGIPAPPSGTVDAPLCVRERVRAGEPKTVVDPERGLPAITHYEIVGRRGPDAVLRLRIETGRTHQIRAHLAHAGHPLRGDARYGGGPGRLLLHAWRVRLVHPVSGRPLEVEAPPPPELRVGA